MPVAAAIKLVRDQALASLEPPALLAAAQLLAGRSVQLPRDIVEVDFHFGYGTCRQHVDAGQVSDVRHLDGAAPAVQQPDRGVERPEGRRRAVIPDDEVQVPGGRRGSVHRG